MLHSRISSIFEKIWLTSSVVIIRLCPPPVEVPNPEEDEESDDEDEDEEEEEEEEELSDR